MNKKEKIGKLLSFSTYSFYWLWLYDLNKIITEIFDLIKLKNTFEQIY
jgi:hypothetical protein